MDIKSVEFSAAFLDALSGSSQSEAESIVDSISFEVSERPVDPTTPFAANDGIVGRMVIRREDGTTAFFALKCNSN